LRIQFMADEQPSLHIDTDWKKQAQEEKRKLAEAQEKQRATEAAAKSAAPTAPADATQWRNISRGFLNRFVQAEHKGRTWICGRGSCK